MTDPPFDLRRAHRWFAVECNNRAWDLLDKSGRSEAETREMIDLAHAARWHWAQVGTEVNEQRALVLLANVYAAIGSGEVALLYAIRCGELTDSSADQLEDFDRAFALDSLARAYAAAGRREEAHAARGHARTAGDTIADPEERAIFDQFFAKGD